MILFGLWNLWGTLRHYLLTTYKTNVNKSVSFLSGGEGIQEGEGERFWKNRQGWQERVHKNWSGNVKARSMREEK